MKKNQSFMVVTSDNWLEVWSIGYSSREKAQLRVDEGYFLKYAMRELKDRRLQVITHEEHENFKKLIKKYDKNHKFRDKFYNLSRKIKNELRK